jgi:hypothetical protein
MQQLSKALLLASILFTADALVNDIVSSDERPQRHDGHSKSESSKRLRQPYKHRNQKQSAWAEQKGALHLEAAEVETETADEIQKNEDQELSAGQKWLAAQADAKRNAVESDASQDWEAVAEAAKAQAVEMKQESTSSVFRYAAAPGGAVAPGPAPGPGPVPVDWDIFHKMEALKPIAEQGFHGPMVSHVDHDTMIGDWHEEHVQSWSTEKEICKVCERHPENSWCKGKCSNSK